MCLYQTLSEWSIILLKNTMGDKQPKRGENMIQLCSEVSVRDFSSYLSICKACKRHGPQLAWHNRYIWLMHHYSIPYFCPGFEVDPKKLYKEREKCDRVILLLLQYDLIVASTLLQDQAKYHVDEIQHEQTIPCCSCPQERMTIKCLSKH